MTTTIDQLPLVIPDFETQRREADKLRDLVRMALGDLLLVANDLDSAVLDLYWVTTGRPFNEVLTEVQGDTYGQLVPKLIASFRSAVADQPLLARFAALESPLRESVDVRNEFVHASWTPNGLGWVERQRRPRRGPPREEIVKMGPDHILAAAEKLGVVEEGLVYIWDDTVQALGGDLPPQLGETRDGITYPNAREYLDMRRR